MSSETVRRFYTTRTISDVPSHYQEHPYFQELIRDPAHSGRIVPGALKEAMAAIEAERQGIVSPPVRRNDNPHIDFIDGKGVPFDIKTPPSPPPSAKYPFDEYASGMSVITKLEKGYLDHNTGKFEPVNILLDTTYLTEADYKKLSEFLDKNTTEEQKSRIFEVKVNLEEKTKSNSITSVISRKMGKTR